MEPQTGHRESAAALRRRLLSPANAKLDAGIDLKRKRDEARAFVPAALMPLVVPMPAPPVTIVGPPPWLDDLLEFNDLLRAVSGVKEGPPLPTKNILALIRAVVAEHYLTTVEELDGPDRRQPFIRARFVAEFLCWRLTATSKVKIGRLFGSRDHTTIMHAIRTVEALMAASPEFSFEINVLAERIHRITG